MRYILLIIVLLILAFSNPNLDAHQNAVKAKVSQLMNNEVNNTNQNTSNIFGEFGKQLGVMFGNSLADGIIKELVKRKDYLFFSLTSIEYNGNNQVIGIGIMGNVFISEEVDKQLNSGKDKIKNAVDILDNSATNTSSENISVGDSYQGGIVFFKERNHFRVVSEENLDFVGTVGTDFERAKDLCENLELNGYNDWYLPDHNELSYIRALFKSGKENYNKDSYYLSSSLNDRGEPMVVHFGSRFTESGGDINNKPFHLLAVRKIGY